MPLQALALHLAQAPWPAETASNDVRNGAPAQLLQRLLERYEASLTFWIARGSVNEHADPPYLLGLLRPRGERPTGCVPAEQRDELAPSHHSINLVAKSSIDGRCWGL
jgi:hypothetical protein